MLARFADKVAAFQSQQLKAGGEEERQVGRQGPPGPMTSSLISSLLLLTYLFTGALGAGSCPRAS